MRNHIIIALCLLFAGFQTMAQSELKNRLDGKQDFREIMKIVDDYYSGQPESWRGKTGEDPKLKHWKRWEWYTSSRLGPNNSFVNIQDSLIKARKIVDKMSPPENSRSVNDTWTSVGPSSTTVGIGRADRIAFHPSDEDIFYVGTPAGGLWRTTDGGSSWEALTDHLPSIGISGVVVDWDNPSTIYILTGDGDSANNGGFVEQFGYARKSIGVLKSTDSGYTWKPTGTLFDGEFLGFKLIQSPISSNILLAATSEGIYRTENSGASWTKTFTGEIFDVEFKPSSNRAYASSANKIYYSLFGGISWVEADLDVPVVSPTRIELAVTPDASGYVYALVGDTNSPGTYGGTYRSTNSGLDYEQRSTTPNILGSELDGTGDNMISAYAISLAASSADAERVVTGGVRIWTSSNGGIDYPSGETGYHADIHELAFNPLNDKLYACTDGGIYISDDEGDTWTGYLDGFNTSQMYHMTGTDLDDFYLLAGFQDNGVKLKTGASDSWTHVRNSDGFDVSFNPIDKTEFYATINQGARRFWNNGSNSTLITPPATDWFCTIRAHVSDENVVFYGSDTIQISNDKGNTWTPVLTSGSWALETCPSNGNRIYAAGDVDYNSSSNGTLSRSNNQGTSWTSLENNPGFPGSASFNKITDIAVDPGDEDFVYVTFGGFFDGFKVYRSDDAGDNWENYSGSLPNIPINSIIVNDAADQVYIGTDVGVFYRHASMNDWMPYNNKLPNVPVTGLFIDENNDILYASTFGRGAWKIDLVDGCPNDMSLGGNFTGNSYYQANNEITTDAEIKGGLNTQVFFKAGQTVLIEPGFRAHKYTKFRAYIGGCGEGGNPADHD